MQKSETRATPDAMMKQDSVMSGSSAMMQRVEAPIPSSTGYMSYDEVAVKAALRA
jgi:hypothetical protein